MPATWTGWSMRDYEVLRKYYPIYGTKVADRLHTPRSKKAITNKAAELGLKYNFSSKHGKNIQEEEEISA